MYRFAIVAPKFRGKLTDATRPSINTTVVEY